MKEPTQSLFYETASDKNTAKMSLYSDIPDLINCRKTFIQEGDPTGYKWAVKYLESWKHWEKLCSWEPFATALESWLRELDTKSRSMSIERIKDIAENGGETQKLSANKYIAEKGWEDKATRGRPSKEELEKELKKRAKLLNETRADAERIGLQLVVNNNG